MLSKKIGSGLFLIFSEIMKLLIVANWKMNPQSLAEAKQLFNSVKRGLKDIRNVEVVICPPFYPSQHFIAILRS